MKITANFHSAVQRLLGDSLAQRLFGPGIWALAIKIASAGFSYIMLVAFARMLDAEAYGEFGVMLNMAIVLSSVIAIGLPTAVMRFWPSHLAQSQPSLAKGFHNSAQKVLFATSVALVLLGIVACVTDFLPLPFSSPLGPVLVACLVATVAFGDYYANALRAQNRVLWSMVPRDIVWRVVSPALAAAVFWWSGGISAATAVISCIIVMAALAGIQGLISHRAARLATGDVSARTDWALWRKPLLPLASASILYAMVQQLDVVVVGSLVGQAEAGAYFAAQKTASLLGLVMIAGGLVAAPMMSSAYQSGKKAELQRLCKMLSAAIALTTLAGLVVLLIIGKPLLGVFDPAYVDAYVILVILAVGYAIDALAGPTAYLMQMTSLEGVYLRIMAIVYGFVLALQFAFVPIYGAIAAAAATASGVCLWNLLAVYYLRTRIGVDSSILSFFLPPRKPNQTEP